MKRIAAMFLAVACLCLLPGCGLLPLPAGATAQPEATQTAAPTPEPTPEPTPAATPTPMPTPEPTPTPFGEEPEHLGTDVLFDLYERQALVDLDGDGTPEELTFLAGGQSSALTINGVVHVIDRAGLAQCFAVTDVDAGDGLLELVFTDRFSELADSEKAFSYLYWWRAPDLIEMGSLMDVKFAGPWKNTLQPEMYFDGQGQITCLTRTQHFTDVWYNARYVCDGADRLLREVAYATSPVNTVPPLTLKHYCVLLKKIDSTYFGFDYYVMWDYASGYSSLSRNYSDDIVAFLPQAGEKLQVVSVYGSQWFKLRASDGKQGWLKCVNMNIQGYYQVMHYTAYDIFSGIVVAG